MWIDPIQPFSVEMPHAASIPAPKFETVSHVEEDGVNVQCYSVPTYISTNVDPPKHFVEDGKAIDEFPLDKFAGVAIVLAVS